MLYFSELEMFSNDIDMAQKTLFIKQVSEQSVIFENVDDI